MAEEKQPAGVVEGATAGDVEEEVQDQQAKSAEDRKAAAALSKLNTREDEGSAPADQQASLSEAMNKLGSGGAPKAEEKKDIRKVKVDAADVTLLVGFLLLVLLSPFAFASFSSRTVLGEGWWDVRGM